MKPSVVMKELKSFVDGYIKSGGVIGKSIEIKQFILWEIL